MIDYLEIAKKYELYDKAENMCNSNPKTPKTPIIENLQIYVKIFNAKLAELKKEKQEIINNKNFDNLRLSEINTAIIEISSTIESINEKIRTIPLYE